MNHDWDFRSPGHTLADLDETLPPTPKRLRKLLRREEATLARVAPDAAAAPPAERDARGRFLQGNKAGTGNPFARQTAAFRTVLMQTVTEEDVAVVVRAVLAKAQAGDVAAAKLLFSYLMGKPTDAPDPDRLELDDWKLLKERLTPLKEDWQQLREIVPVEGLVEAGHRVADLRAAAWRAETLGPHKPSESPKGTAASGRRNPALLRAALAVIEAEPGASAEWKADTTRMLIEADEAGCLHELLDALRAETEKSLGALSGAGQPVPPSANGTSTATSPSANGHAVRHAPSPNGTHDQPAPSPNGGCGRTDLAGDTVVEDVFPRRRINLPPS